MAAFKRKVFVSQESPLTILGKTRSGKFFLSLYCITVILYLISCIAIYMIDHQTARWELDFVLSAFSNLPAALLLWILHHTLVVLVFFPMTQLWVDCEWNSAVFLSLGSFILPTVMLSSSFIFCFVVQMGISCKIFIGMEAVRLSMKVISFTCETRLRLKHRDKNISNTSLDMNGNVEEAKNTDLKMGHFVYFLFAPTVIYRESYPRSHSRKWSRIFFYFLILLSLIFIGFKLAFATSKPFFESKKSNSLPASIVLQALPLVIFTTVYAVLVGVGIAFMDVWSNIFAELLRFGDRGFYQDWWTQHDILQFLMKWNNINQTWLFEYIYEPFRGKYGKRFAGLAVMAVSGFFHDYLMVSTFSVFLPICSGGQITAWIISQSFFPDRRKVKTLPGITEERIPSLLTFMGSTYNFFGFAIVYMFCLLEYYSRQHCPIKEPSIMSFVTPRLFHCLEWD